MRPGSMISRRPSAGRAPASAKRRRPNWPSRTICPDDIPGSNARWLIRTSGFAGMPLAFTLAFRNRFHDRRRLIATVIGIVFSIGLVPGEMALYRGWGENVIAMIDHGPADLW